MQMAMAVGECSGEDADLLRRAMGSKRGVERIESVKERLFEGMARNGLVGAQAETIYAQILAFANFGFAESHSLSFALLVYASSWLKLHYPAAFLAGLDGSCQTPIAGLAEIGGGRLRLRGEILRPDGSERLAHASEGATGDGDALGAEAAAVLRGRAGPNFFG